MRLLLSIQNEVRVQRGSSQKREVRGSPKIRCDRSC